MRSLLLLRLPVLTLFCWWYAFRLFRSSLEPLHSTANEAADVSTTAQAVHNLPAQELQHLLKDTPVLDDRPTGLFYFVHISDIHVSAFQPTGSIEHLRAFLRVTLPMIRPQFVLVTGDLTDAKDGWKLSSQQYQHEWVEYHRALVEAGVLKQKNFWFDQRGNHDCFNVPGWHSDVNFFREYSATKEEQYAFQFKRDYGTYTFIGLDACPIHGPSRPFNFFGYFDSADMNYFQQRLAHYSRNSNHTVVLSHYPISTTLTGRTSDGQKFGDLARYFSVFLSGHLHRLVGGLGDMLHAHHPERFLELELGDMKKHASYRIMAIDHDLISFIDTSLFPTENAVQPSGVTIDVDHPAPVVLITNPKDARYFIPEHEPIHRIAASSHIRILTFSPKLVVRVVISIDGKPHARPVKYVGALPPDSNLDFTPLWTSPWSPSEYNDSRTHIMTVWAVDEDGRNGTQTISFRVDGREIPIPSRAGKYILTSRISYWLRTCFFLTYVIITVLFLLLPKMVSLYLHHGRRYHRWRLSYSAFLLSMDQSQKIPLIPVRDLSSWFLRQLQIIYYRLKLVYHDFRFFLHATIFRLVTLVSLRRTFYPLFLHALYIVVGPYFIGELIPIASIRPGPKFSQYGAFYVYGMYINGNWVPLLDTWMFGLLELLYILGPLTLYLSFCITPPTQLYSHQPEEKHPDPDVLYFPPKHNRRHHPIHRNIYIRFAVAGVVLYQLVNVFFIGIFYGPVAVVLSPGKTWFVAWACWALWRHRWSEKGVEVDLQPATPLPPKRNKSWNKAGSLFKESDDGDTSSLDSLVVGGKGRKSR